MSGKAGDTFMVNAWGRGTPLPPTDRDPDRHFGIEVVFTDAEGEKDVHHEEFSADILDWQFLSRIVVAKKDYVKVQVSYVYSHQANTAYFEGLALFLEEFGQSYIYDEDNNLISAVDNQKNRQEFEYSDANDMTGVTDAKGNSFTYVYDDKHRVTQGTSAEGVVYRYEYDDATGNVQKSGVVLVEEDPAEPEKGTWVTRTMTSDKNHVASVTDAEGNTVRYGWNLKKDLMTSLTDAKGNKLSYTYDVQKRLTKVSQDVTVGGAVTKVANEYAYADDRLSSILHNGFRYGFAYDGFGNTEAVTIAGENVVSYEYGAGNEELVRTVYGNGAGIRYTYDDQDRLKKSYYCDSASGTEAELNTYVYDKQGNLQKVTNHPSGKTYILSYDFLDRLMRVRDEAGNIYEYTYDVFRQVKIPKIGKIIPCF